MITLVSVWLATACYVAAIAYWLMRKPEPARVVWLVGLVLYLIHFVAAFAFHHHWSQREALEFTARQTRDTVGIDWGGGLYFNYLFTTIWATDVLWLYAGQSGYARRPRWISVAVHGFLGFMFFNAVIVFGHGWIRWAGIAALAWLAALWRRRRFITQS